MLSGFVIELLFGSQFIEAVGYVFSVSLWIVPFSFISILSNYMLAVNKAKFLSLTLIIGCIMSFILILIFNETIYQIVHILALISFAILIANIVSIIYMKEKLHFSGVNTDD